jgi:hypothetical protein
MGRLSLLLAAAVFACASGARAAPAIVITEHGVAGVRPGVTLAQVKARLDASFAGGQFGRELDGAVCGGAVQGEAEFAIGSHGPRLWGIAFTAGVVTHQGIKPGSTLGQLERVYGKRLRLDSDPDIHEADSDVVRPADPHGYTLVFTVDVWTKRVLAIGLALGDVLAVHCPTAVTPPPSIGVLSLAGASGITLFMPQPQVLATWPWFPSLTDGDATGSDSWMPVCAGTTRGAVTFGGFALASMFFNSGASTDTGITIGSTLEELKASYGADLTAIGPTEYEVYARGGPPTATLGFDVKNGVVTAIGFGGRQSIHRGYVVPRIWC